MAVSDYDPIIDAAAKEWDVDPNWVRSVMHQESGGSPVDKYGRPITSTAGAGGLMQIMPGTATDLGVSNVHDPVQAIWGGTKYLAQLRDQFNGNVPMATAAYNAGPKRVAQANGNLAALPSETQAYLPKVAGYYKQYAGQNKHPVSAAASDIPSDDDFLKQVAPKQGQTSAIPSDDDFLKMVGAKPSAAPAPVLPDGPLPTPPIPPPDAAQRATSDMGDTALTSDQIIQSRERSQSSPYSALEPSEPGFKHLLWTVAEPFARIGETALGYHPIPSGGPALEQAAAVSPTGLRFSNPLMARPMARPSPAAADVAQGGAVQNPLMSPAAPGPAATLTPTMRVVAPDFVPPGSAVPSGPMMHALISEDNRIAAARPAEIPPPGASVVDPVTGQAAPIQQPRNPLAVEQTVPYNSNPLDTAYLPPTQGATVPTESTVGAAATAPGAFNRTAREISGSHADMELADLMKTPKAGDATEYVPGVTPTKAEIEQSPAVSREAKGLRQEFREGFNEKEKADNERYHQAFDDMAGSAEQIGVLKDSREARAERDLSATFTNRSATNPQPVVDTINGILSDPRHGERDVVKKYVTPYLEKLRNADGTPKTDPLSLYGVRENITDQLSKLGSQEFPGVGLVEGHLIQVKNALDGAIEAGAPGFAAYRENYANASRPIEAMQRLQDAKLKLTNGSDRTITFGKFDSMMKNLWVERHNNNPLSPAKSIDQPTWDNLLNIHRSLARSASDQELARTRGSDTTQMLGQMLRGGIGLAAHGAAAAYTGGVGNVAIPMIKASIERRSAMKKVNKHLNPDVTKYPFSGAP